MFTAWKSGRKHSADIGHELGLNEVEGMSGYTYRDGSYIICKGNWFYTVAETFEFEHAYLKNVEVWLWNHHSRFSKDAGEVCE